MLNQIKKFGLLILLLFFFVPAGISFSQKPTGDGVPESQGLMNCLDAVDEAIECASSSDCDDLDMAYIMVDIYIFCTAGV